jgi:hypothetical protein
LVNEVGLEIGYARLSAYVGQLKSEEAGLAGSTAVAEKMSSAVNND